MTLESKASPISSALLLEDRNNIDLKCSMISSVIKQKLGIDVPIPKPPDQAFEALRFLEHKGIGGFELIYLPSGQLNRLPLSMSYKKPKINIILSGGREGLPSKEDLLTVFGGWYLIDSRKKPSIHGSQNTYPNDYLHPILKLLRKQEKIANYLLSRKDPGTRFGLSFDEITHIVIPQTNELLDNKLKATVPTLSQANMIGNLYHPEWGFTSSSEWYDNVFGKSPRMTFYGGWQKYTEADGIANVGVKETDQRNPNIAFRLQFRIPFR